MCDKKVGGDVVEREEDFPLPGIGSVPRDDGSRGERENNPTNFRVAHTASPVSGRLREGQDLSYQTGYGDSTRFGIRRGR